ncbi:MAG: helix-turn-helix transcriptional regulator [Firmicutes bacterium]|nr:helix-turn-helix transcriptional regulator [Bacillota bacterium]
MILADKIIHLRKLLALTQEELAAQLRVSRQAVSKWEGALSVPDMERIIQLARFFRVTIDYLLKDEMQSPEHFAADPEGAPGDKRTAMTIFDAEEWMVVSIYSRTNTLTVPRHPNML